MKGRFLFSQHRLLTNNFVTDFEKIRPRQDSTKMLVCRQSTLNKTLGSGGQKIFFLPGYHMGFALNTLFDCFKNLPTQKIKKKLPSFQIIVNDISRQFGISPYHTCQTCLEQKREISFFSPRNSEIQDVYRKNHILVSNGYVVLKLGLCTAYLM